MNVSSEFHLINKFCESSKVVFVKLNWIFFFIGSSLITSLISLYKYIISLKSKKVKVVIVRIDYYKWENIRIRYVKINFKYVLVVLRENHWKWKFINKTTNFDINIYFYYVNQDLNNFKILKISNSFYLKLDI